MFGFLRTKKNLSNESDAMIIAQYKREQNSAFIGILYERYAQLVFAVCMKYLKNEEDSKDAVSRIFEKLFDDLKKYEIKQFNLWIHRVAQNYCFSELQKQKTIEHHLDETTLQQISNDADEQNENLNYTDEQLQKAINSLDEHQRICIELFYLHNKRYIAITELTDYSILQVKSYIQNGKRNLKNYLTTQNERANS